MSSKDLSQNTYLHGPLVPTYIKTALPIIFVMSMSGMLTVVDAVFLGLFTGPEAVGAVTLMFPAFILMVALSTLVSSGLSSLLARHIGAARFDHARAVFTSAHALALTISCSLIGLFLIFGHALTLAAANGSPVLAEMAHTYLGITVLFSPLMFIMSVNSDALRSEGRTGLMALISLGVSLANIAFNYILIAEMKLGVAGSAYGTVVAQGLALFTLVVFRFYGRTELRPTALFRYNPFAGWTRILALGAPQSLSFIGIGLVSATVIAMLQLVGGESYTITVTAYGIITRIMTFVFLPLLGLSLAMQSIAGNNFGAGLRQRSDDSLRLGIAAAFVYCLTAQIVLTIKARSIGLVFVTDEGVADEVARIMPVMVALYVVTGPLLMIAGYFQATGNAVRAALLSLPKPYLFAMPLIVILAHAVGEQGIWLAMPTAESLLLAVAITVLFSASRKSGLSWGLFQAPQK